jgi:lysophospholipase L1-like esterase
VYGRAFFVTGFFLVSCASVVVHKGPMIVSPHDARIRYVGRFDARQEGVVRFAWPASQVRARFDGRSLHAWLSSTPVEDETRETDSITVVVDGGEPRTFALAEGKHLYPLATDLDDDQHDVLIWKETEAEVGTIGFHGFVLEAAKMLRELPEPPKRHIEGVGDSITAGFGNKGPDPSCAWSAKLQNNYFTYGAFAARELGASYSAYAWSGKGAYRNFDPRDTLTLPQLYTRIIPTEDDSPLTPSLGRADAVVVNLGTNDFGDGPPFKEPFIAAYVSFLEALRSQHRAALIVVAFGPMLADDYPYPNARSTARAWIQEAMAARAKAGDARIAFLEMWIDPKEGVGCQGHPNINTHARLGKELAALLREKLDW